MTKNLLSSALLAGVAAGLIAALLQFSFVIPLILEGELYETGERVHFAIDGSTQSDRALPALGDDFARHGMTLAFNVVTYSGYGLILLALMVFAQRKGTALTPRAGLIWGVAGFITLQLAPGVSQPPVLPGVIGAEMGLRQTWWVFTVVSTGSALGLIAFAKGWVTLLSVPLLLIPHIIGAPYLDTYFGVAPPELSARFAARSFGASLAGWSLLGFLTAWFWTRTDEG